MPTDKPNSGSTEAIKQGCRCPVVDNHHSKGSERGFIVVLSCPLHGDEKHADR